MTALIKRAGVIARARVRPNASTSCGGPASICTQHGIPQPAAQGQLLSWLVGNDEPSTAVAAVHRLDLNGAPVATDNGNSSACKATT
jgi:hypothetical protein